MFTKSQLLFTLFGSHARVGVLGLLLANPDKEYYQRQMGAILGFSVMSVQRELRKLKKINLVIETKRGKQKFYRMNKKSPIFNELKMIFLKTVLVNEVLKKCLKKEKKKIEVAFIYGSFAKGEEKEESDIDLFVIGNISNRELSARLSEAKRTVSREINFVVYSKEEFKKRILNGDHFLKSIMKEAKIFVLGDQNVLEKMAK